MQGYERREARRGSPTRSVETLASHYHQLTSEGRSFPSRRCARGGYLSWGSNGDGRLGLPRRRGVDMRAEPLAGGMLFRDAVTVKETLGKAVAVEALKVKYFRAQDT